jgi:hypothetical protein
MATDKKMNLSRGRGWEGVGGGEGEGRVVPRPCLLGPPRCWAVGKVLFLFENTPIKIKVLLAWRSWKQMRNKFLWQRIRN